MATTRTYSLHKVPEDAKFRGQQALIIEDLKTNPNSTTKQIADRIKGKLETRQDPERVVGFYMSTWKKKGLVAVAEVETPDDENTDAQGEPEDGDEEDEEDEDEPAASGEGLSLDERNELETEMAASAPEEHGGKFDGLKMSEAVKRVLHLKNLKLSDAESIAAYLTENDYPATKNQVSGALMNLVRTGVAKKSDLNTFSIR